MDLPAGAGQVLASTGGKINPAHVNHSSSAKPDTGLDAVRPERVSSKKTKPARVVVAVEMLLLQC
jgi:hypothetical protein